MSPYGAGTRGRANGDLARSNRHGVLRSQSPDHRRCSPTVDGPPGRTVRPLLVQECRADRSHSIDGGRRQKNRRSCPVDLIEVKRRFRRAPEDVPSSREECRCHLTSLLSSLQLPACSSSSRSYSRMGIGHGGSQATTTASRASRTPKRPRSSGRRRSIGDRSVGVFPPRGRQLFVFAASSGLPRKANCLTPIKGISARPWSLALFGVAF